MSSPNKDRQERMRRQAAAASVQMSSDLCAVVDKASFKSPKPFAIFLECRCEERLYRRSAMCPEFAHRSQAPRARREHSATAQR